MYVERSASFWFELRNHIVWNGELAVKNSSQFFAWYLSTRNNDKYIFTNCTFDIHTFLADMLHWVNWPYFLIWFRNQTSLFKMRKKIWLIVRSELNLKLLEAWISWEIVSWYRTNSSSSPFKTSFYCMNLKSIRTVERSQDWIYVGVR